MSPRKAKLINEIIRIGGLKSDVFRLKQFGNRTNEIIDRLDYQRNGLTEDEKKIVLYHIADYNRLILSTECTEPLMYIKKPRGVAKDIQQPIYFSLLGWSDETLGNFHLN